MVIENLCPVCGYEMEEPPRDYNICPSCGTEFGVHDVNASISELRAAWMQSGPRWWSKTDTQPDNWNPLAQLATLDARKSMAHYPLMFTLWDAVSGNAFLAGVTLTGRALMVKESENDWWIYGVRPAAIAETGSTPEEACLRFHNRYKKVLFDISEESSDYEVFKKSVEDFYFQPDVEEETRWEDARKALRGAEVIPEKPFSELPKESPESRPPQIAVARLDKLKRFQSSDNVPDTFVMATAA